MATNTSKGRFILSYYDTNSNEFIENSINSDMTDLYNEFLKHIPKNGYILDAGCGSGRDSKYFTENKYNVDAFDLSAEMVKYASELTGINVKQMSFEYLTITNKYDGVWACASLLHIPNKKLSESIQKCINTLKQNGVLYCSFKYGEENHTDDNDRKFTNMTEQTIEKYIPNNTEIINIWTTKDVRKDKQQKWLNALIKNKNRF